MNDNPTRIDMNRNDSPGAEATRRWFPDEAPLALAAAYLDLRARNAELEAIVGRLPLPGRR